MSKESQKKNYQWLWSLLLPGIVLTGLTVWLRLDPAADIGASGAFFDEETGEWSEKGWKAFFGFLYDQGPKPALFVAIGGLLLFMAERILHRRTNRDALYLALVMLIGPGILINALLKPEWGRPRPKEITEFGGELRFERVWEFDPSSEGKSFPSGHASMGFYFFAVAFLFHRRKKRWAPAVFACALAYGALMGMTRIVQGGHFLSDVIWSAGICWFTAALLAPMIRDEKAPGEIPVVPPG